MKNQRVNIEKRIRNMQVVLYILLAIVVLRYAQLQLWQGNELAERIREQVVKNERIQSPRGKILDRNGRELAISTMTKTLFFDPQNIMDPEYNKVPPEEIAAEFAPILKMSEQEILDKIAEGGRYVIVKHNLEQDEYEAVKKLQEKKYSSCMNFEDEAKRYYPSDMLAANVVGFVGAEDKGLGGIEVSMEKLLKGDVTEERVKTDHSSLPIMESIFTRYRKYRGDACKTVTLTIDSAIQFIVEQELDRAMAENNPKGVTAVVMNPKTGEILAMASRPSYNPNRFWDYGPETWGNPAVASMYEPGSTFKSIVAGAALEERVVSPNEVFVDPGYVMVSERRIQNWSGTSFGTVTFTDVVKQSLNTGFVEVGLRLGGVKLTDYAKKFGFGKATGVDLPGEPDGILFDDPAHMLASDVATMSIGQSISVTPLQLVTAMSAIANKGVLFQPRILQSIQNSDGSVYEGEKSEHTVEGHPQTGTKVLDEATDQTLIGLLEQVVKSGGGSKASVKGYRIAGKTGTAQKTNEGSTGYREGAYIASFCGFAPVEDPQLTVLVIIDEPSAGNYYGGQIAAPVASRIFAQLFRYLHIAPSSDPFANVEMEKSKTAKKKSEKPFTGTIPEGKTLVPDFTGKSLREASGLADDKNLSFRGEGSGYATDQSIPANTVVDEGREVTVYFRPE